MINFKTPPPRQPPDFAAFHRSLSDELYAVKDRIRNLVLHWGTDGASKEVALRSVLRRHLPKSVVIGTGFIVSEKYSSTQIDILIVDASKPMLFSDGDLIIVTPDAVRAIIEVKTELRTKSAASIVLRKMSEIESQCYKLTRRNSIWTGLFIYEAVPEAAVRLLGGLREARRSTLRPIRSVCCGRDIFIRYWDKGNVMTKVPVWHAYELEGMAPSYFIGNLIDSISELDESVAGFAWFPYLGGKEYARTHQLIVDGSSGVVDTSNFTDSQSNDA